MVVVVGEEEEEVMAEVGAGVEVAMVIAGFGDVVVVAIENRLEGESLLLTTKHEHIGDGHPMQ